MRTTVLIVVLSIALLSTAALADAPGLINYQGTLTDTNGVALNTIVTMTFTIYTDSTGGAPVWTETQPLVEVSNGLFNVLLGRVNAISENVFNGMSRWLGVRVESDPELEPRQRIAAVGYALRASVADTADFARAPAPSDGDWTITGNHIYSAVPGSVGIGTISPDAKLHVVGGNVAVSDAGDATGIKIAESWITDPYDGALHIQSGGDVVAFDGNDDVCIGTTSPSGKLTVDGGNAIIKGGDGWDGSDDEALLYLGDNNHGIEAVYGQGLRIWTFDDASSDIRFRGHTGTDYMTIQMNSGKVGIGTTSPGAMLDVSGDVNTDSLYKIRGNTVLSVSSTMNTLVGVGAGANNTGDYGTFVGYNAGYNNQGSGNTFLGEGAGLSNTTGYNNTFLGKGAGAYNDTSSANTFVGRDAGYHNKVHGNTFLGNEAGYSNTSGDNNTFVGEEAGYSNTTSMWNTFVGANAGQHNEAPYNAFVGALAGSSNTSGAQNTFIGSFAGISNTSGGYNTFLGHDAGENNTTGNFNIFIGMGAGIWNETGSCNTYIGYDTGIYNTAGDSNVFIGLEAGYYETGSNKLYIANGYDTSNVLIYGDFSTGNVGLGTLSPGYKLDVAGDINTTGEVRQNGSAYLHPDYVFEPGYELMSLAELSDFVAAKKHLPGMPSAEEVKKDGVKLFEQNRLLLEKLEEAYLYIIELQNRVAKLETVAEAKLTAGL
jgi:hypothetical protein